MVFAVCGMVRWKGQKLANGIDGKFETENPKIITRLQTLGFQEYVEKEVESKQPETNQNVETSNETKKPKAYRGKQK